MKFFLGGFVMFLITFLTLFCCLGSKAKSKPVHHLSFRQPVAKA